MYPYAVRVGARPFVTLKGILTETERTVSRYVCEIAASSPGGRQGDRLRRRAPSWVAVGKSTVDTVRWGLE